MSTVKIGDIIAARQVSVWIIISTSTEADWQETLPLHILFFSVLIEDGRESTWLFYLFCNATLLKMQTLYFPAILLSMRKVCFSLFFFLENFYDASHII